MKGQITSVESHRFFVSDPPSDDEMVLRGDVAHRIARVLRLTAGSAVTLFDGSGRSWPAEVLAVQGQIVRLAIGPPVQHPLDCVTNLLAGMIRPNRFEWLIEKATELGATAILPVICTRSAVRPAEIGPSRLERWRRIAIEAAEQCGRVTVPQIQTPQPFAAALDSVAGRFFIAAEPAHGTTQPLGTALHHIGGDPATLLIGPEGGLTPDEIQHATDAGAQPVSLGPRILRAETAAMAALSILVDARQRS
jgi:16S rRNA (uracil1498-N3)-methyltransferase